MISEEPSTRSPSPPASTAPPSTEAAARSVQVSPADRDLALRRYAPILGYLQYENTVYWTRFHVFLLADSALFALLANRLPFDVSVVTWARLYTLIVTAIGGLVLAGLWWKTLVAARGWIER